MKKYLRAMFYGSGKTKAYLWTVVLAAVASFGCLVACVMGAGLPFAYAAFGGTIFSIMYSQLGVFKDVNVEIDQRDKLERSIQHREAEENGNAGSKKKKTEEAEQAEPNELDRYTEESIKRYLTAYKAKQETYCVLVDSSEKYHLNKCPAYIWSDKNYLFLMALEKKPRVIHMMRKDVATLRYEKGIVITDMEEYKKVKESIFISSKFRKLFPEYYKASVNGLTTFKKNLFVLGEDLRITTPSAAGMIKAVQCRLELTNKQIDRERFGGYFEEVYKAKLLLNEKAYDQEEYDEKVRQLLVVLAEHEEKIEVFQTIISQLVQYRMISQETAEFYMEYRGKLEEKRRGRKR